MLINCGTPLLRQYAVVFIVNLSIFIGGLFLSWPSPMLIKLRDPEESVLGRPVTDDEGAWVVSIGFLVAIFANLMPALLLDRIGRKYCLLIGAAPKLLAGLLFTFATELWMLLLGRAIAGASDICIFNIVAIYASEIASTKIRGALGTILHIMCSLGVVTMLSMGPFTPYVTMNAVITGVTVFTFIPLLFLPESPYFLYSKGRNEEAVSLLTYLRGSEDLAKEELKEYSLAENKKEVVVRRRDFFKDRTFLKAVGITCCIGVGIQLIGYNVVNVYLQTVLESTNTSVAPEIASVIIGVIQLTAGICTSLVTDRFGRKPILSVTLVVLSAGMFGLGTFFWVSEDMDDIPGALNYLPLVSLILVVFSYSAGLGAVYFALMAELYSGTTRAIGTSIGNTVTMIFTFLSTRYFVSITVALGTAPTYWLFGSNCILLCLFILIFVPETKGKTFSEIQLALDGQNSSKDEEVAGNPS